MYEKRPLTHTHTYTTHSGYSDIEGEIIHGAGRNKSNNMSTEKSIFAIGDF